MKTTRILTNAKILNPSGDGFSRGTLSLTGGWIQQITPGDSSRHHAGAEIVDLEGRYVMPGLCDAHLHLRNTALNLDKVDCDTPTKEECLARIRKRAESTPRGEWILGHGWNQNRWVTGFGSADDLDQAAPDHPVYLTAKSLHASWANTRALRAAGIHSSTPDPEGGRFSRDPHGQPTGILFENAMKQIEDILPEPGPRETARLIERAQVYLWKMGVTSVHDFDRSRCFSALQILEQQDRLKLRVLKQIHVDQLPEAAAVGLRSGFGSEFLKIGGIKIFADGALGPQTAAMLEPYQGQGDNRGMLLLPAEELEEVSVQAVKQGFSLAIHAIGDLANRLVLNTLKAVRDCEDALGLPRGRHRIEHVQLLEKSDLGRLAELDIIASMQPVHAPSDRDIADQVWGNRARYAYAWNSLLQHQTRLAFGSDAPVEHPNPFWGIYAAVSRRDHRASPPQQIWYPEEAISRQQALQAYTLGPAYAAGWEDYSGALRAGCWADLVVLEENVLTCSLEDLPGLSPAATMVDGEFVWGSI